MREEAMKFLKSERAYLRWAAGVNRGQPQAPITPPVEFPCFAYLEVGSFGYEEERAEYLYRDDVRRMQGKLEGTK